MKEEKAADQTLTGIAEESINEEAAEVWQFQREERMLAQSAQWAGATAGSESRQLAKVRGASQRPLVSLKIDRRDTGHVALQHPDARGGPRKETVTLDESFARVGGRLA